jgi:hypothetical protein
MSTIQRSAAVALALAASIVVGGCIGTRIGGPGSRTASPTRAPSPVVVASSPSPSPAASAVEPQPSASDEMTGTAGPGCGTGQKGFFAHRDQIQEVLTIDGTPIELTTAAVGLRNGTYDADDAIPRYVGLTSDEVAVKDVPAGKLVLAANGMTLIKLTVGTVPWSTLDFSAELPSTTAKLKPAMWHLATNGRIVILAPSKVGEYMLDMTVDWQTECLRGDGTAYARIVIN